MGKKLKKLFELSQNNSQIHKKMEFSIEDFFSKYDQIKENYGFSPIYQRNPQWKNSFLRSACEQFSQEISIVYV